MKVKNEYVQIKVGNKVYTHKNMILNEYLYRLFNSQINTIHDTCYIGMCYLKLDTPIENVDYDSEISPSNFDITIIDRPNKKTFNRKTTRTNNSILVNYTFDSCSSYLINGEYFESIIMNSYANRKIMGIGFGLNNTDNIFAYLDTSSMNIVINKNEAISISRLDLLQSDGVCDGFDYPLHLVNDLAFKDETEKITEQGYTLEYTKAQLYSVGFGNVRGLMEQEYLINDVETERDNSSITFNVQRDKMMSHYPSKDLWLGFTPIKDNSKYVLFKYRLYRIDKFENVTYLNEYYTMSMPNENFGNLNIKLKIERL